MERPIARPHPFRVRGLLHPSCGPLVRLEVRNGRGGRANGLAVLDTGASMSAIDRDTARGLDLPSPGAARWSAVSDTSDHHPVSALRTSLLRVADDRRVFALDLIEVPGLIDAVEGYSVIALLGWDFLGDCQLSCDGPAGTFELFLPTGRGTARRR